MVCSLIERIMLFCIPPLSFVWLEASICALKNEKEKRQRDELSRKKNQTYLLVMQCSLHCCCCRRCPFKYLFKRALIFCCHLLTVVFCQAHGILNSIDLDTVFSFSFLFLSWNSRFWKIEQDVWWTEASHQHSINRWTVQPNQLIKYSFTWYSNK